MTHQPVPDSETEARDQRQFDEAVNTKGKVVLEWFAGAGILAALLMSTVALVRSGDSTAASQPVVKQAAASAPSASSAAVVASTAPAKVDSLKIIPTYKLGPDGKKHDAFTQTEFAVKVGQPLKLTIDNTDNGLHSITSPVAGVNIVVQPASTPTRWSSPRPAGSSGTARSRATATPTDGRCRTPAS